MSDDLENEHVMAPRRLSDKRRVIRFDPTVSSGTILQSLLLVIGAVAGYGQYQADKAKDHAEVAQIKVDADVQRVSVKEKLDDLRTNVNGIQHTLSDVVNTVTILKERSDAQRSK